MPVRNSCSLEAYHLRGGRRRSESLEPPENRAATLGHRRNLSMEPQELARDLAAAVEDLNILPLSHKTTPLNDAPMNVDATHDYAEIYTPSCEKAPLWAMKSGLVSGNSSTATVDSVADLSSTARAPTPPLHRFPSWEAKIYQVANDGLAPADENDAPDADATQTTRSQQTASGGYCDISVPVYATVKGVCILKIRQSDEILLILTLFVIPACFPNPFDAIHR